MSVSKSIQVFQIVKTGHQGISKIIEVHKNKIVFCNLSNDCFVFFLLNILTGLKKVKKSIYTVLQEGVMTHSFISIEFSNVPENSILALQNTYLDLYDLFFSQQFFDPLHTTHDPLVVSFTFQIDKILVQSHFELVSLVLALEATELVSELVKVNHLEFSLIESLHNTAN